VVCDVVVELWTGALVVRRLGPAAEVDVGGQRVPFDDLSPEQLASYLDEFAVAFVPANDGVMPRVRVMERFGLPTGFGAAGSVPR